MSLEQETNREILTQQLRELQEEKLQLELQFSQLPQQGLRQDRGQGLDLANKIVQRSNAIKAKLKEIELFDFRFGDSDVIMQTPEQLQLSQQEPISLKKLAIIGGAFLLLS